MGLPDPAPREKKHQRNIDCVGYRRDDGLWDIDVHLVDTRSYDCGYADYHRGDLIRAGEPVHDMWLRFTIDLDFEIRDVQAASVQTPFDICPHAADAMRDLIGLKIGPGWLAQARARVARERSCTHLMDLLGPLAKTAFQTLHAELDARDKARPAREKPAILDTCLALSSSGEAVKKLWPEFYVPAGDEESGA